MAALVEMPCWYLLFGLVLTLYQAYRGFRFQWIATKEQNKNSQYRQQTNPLVSHVYSDADIIFLRSVADSLLYGISSAAGFVALYLAYKWPNELAPIKEISAGASAVLIFLALFGVVGIAGQLPHLLQQGKFPK